MASSFSAALRPLYRCALAAAAIFGGTAPAAAYLPQSWNGYHWARTGPLQLALGDNVSAAWKPFFTTAARQWSAGNPNLSFAATIGTTAPATCSPVYGTVQACSGNYGATGWLGFATIWTGGGGYVVEATVKLNDYYFGAGSSYATDAFRAQTACQEIGHTLGLAHADVNRSNLNLGTCMDYSSDPAGTHGTNGALANTAPSAADFTALAAIYATLNPTQLSYTKPQYRIADALSIDGEEHDEFEMLPEPASWALLLVGFGGVGAMMRRKAAAGLPATA